jgi:RNA recognition motif-containing protein
LTENDNTLIKEYFNLKYENNVVAVQIQPDFTIFSRMVKDKMNDEKILKKYKENLSVFSFLFDWISNCGKFNPITSYEKKILKKQAKIINKCEQKIKNCGICYVTFNKTEYAQNEIKEYTFLKYMISWLYYFRILKFKDPILRYEQWIIEKASEPQV